MGYSNCNPCDPCGTNQNAAKAAAYARQANTYATNAENSWLEFNALYLGAFAVAPTVDNEGDPLQVGALYWNTGSNLLYAWNGTAWVVTNSFNEFTPFLATGTTTPRNLVTRMADVVNVLDFGADPTGIVDCRVAVNAAIATGKSVFFPKGVYKYIVTTTNAITPATGSTIFGIDAEIQLETANTVSFFNIFDLNQSNITIKDLKLTWTTPASSAGGIGLFAFNGGNNYTIDNVEAYLDTQSIGGIRNAPNHLFMINGSVNDVYISNSRFTRAAYGILKTNTSTAVNKNWEFNSNIFEDFFAPQLTFNTPSGDWDNVRVINNELRNSLAYTLSAISNPFIHMGGLAGGSGSGRFVWANNTFTGTGQGIHFEEGAEEVIIDGNNFATTDIAIQILDNNVGGTYLTPQKFIISNNTIVQTGTKVKLITNIGIDCIFDSTTFPAVRDIIISDNIIADWEEGIKMAEDGYRYKISNNLIKNCPIGIKSPNTAEIANNTFDSCSNGILEILHGAYVNKNKFISCTTPIGTTSVNGIASDGEEYYIEETIATGVQTVDICPIGARRDAKVVVYLTGGFSRRFATFNITWDGTTLTGGTATISTGSGSLINLTLQESSGILQVSVNNTTGSSQLVSISFGIIGGSFYL